MADSTLALLTASGDLTGSELFYADSGVADVKVTATQLRTWCVGAGSVSVLSNKTLTVNNTLTLSGTDGSTLAIGSGGTLGSAAYTASSAYDASGAASSAVSTHAALQTGVHGISITAGKTLSANNSITLAGADGTTMTFPPVNAAIGYMNIPLGAGGAAQTTSYTGVLNDQGCMIVMNAATLTFTIPANASVAYPVGTVITIVNTFAGNLSIAIAADTMTLAGSTTAGTRTLAQNGIATAIKVSATSWLISGTGLT